MMIRSYSLILLPLLSIFFLPTATPYGAEYRAGFDISESYLSQSRYLDRYENRFSYDENNNLASVGAAVSVTMTEYTRGYFRGYLYWLHGFNDASTETDELDFYLVDAHLDIGSRSRFIRLGVQSLEWARGAIFSDDTIAAFIHLGKGPLYADVIGARVMDNSPMVGGAIGYRLGAFQQIETFLLYYEDRENALSRAYSQYTAVNDLTNEGYLSWIGLSAEFFIGNLYLTAVGAYQYGHMEFSQVRRQFGRNVSAYMFDLGMETNLTNRFSVGIFCFAASGDEQPFQDDLSTFVSPLPFNRRAVIFFDPYFMDIDPTDTLVFGGTTVKGVIAPGLTFTFEPVTDLFVAGKAASFYSQFKADAHGSWYGWEMDLDISYRINSNILLFIEAARFEHGDFWDAQLQESPQETIRLFLGGRFSFVM